LLRDDRGFQLVGVNLVFTLLSGPKRGGRQGSPQRLRESGGRRGRCQRCTSPINLYVNLASVNSDSVDCGTGATSTTSNPTTVRAAHTARSSDSPSCHVSPFGSAVPTAGTTLGSKPSASIVT